MDCPLNSKPCVNPKLFELVLFEKNATKFYNICQNCINAENLQDHLFISCKKCGSTAFDLEKTKKFGCADCYEIFKIHAENCFKICQHDNKHCGKKPNFLNHLNIDQLKLKIKQYIQEENYELASLCKKLIEQKSNL